MPGELGILEPGEPAGMPGWAAWLGAVGVAAAEHAGPSRLVIAITVPTRALAAVLVVLGACRRLYEEGFGVADHWELIRQLPAGTIVRHLDRGRYYTCSTILGVVERDGVAYLQLSGGLQKRHDKCLDVMPLSSGELPFTRRRIPKDYAFLMAALPGVDPRDYVTRNTTSALLVGSKSRLGSELETLDLAVLGTAEHGPASAIVRPRIQPGSPHRTDLISATADELPARASERVKVAVLDGATATLRWRNRVSARAVVVLLDRTVTSSTDAADALASDRARCLALADLSGAGTAPRGVEWIAFEERP